MVISKKLTANFVTHFSNFIFIELESVETLDSKNIGKRIIDKLNSFGIDRKGMEILSKIYGQKVVMFQLGKPIEEIMKYNKFIINWNTEWTDGYSIFSFANSINGQILMLAYHSKAELIEEFLLHVNE